MSDLNKFQVVISKLPKDIICQLTDLLINPPNTNKYEAIKQILLTIHEERETKTIQKFISEMDLDQKPSQLLQKMRDLARGKITVKKR